MYIGAKTPRRHKMSNNKKNVKTQNSVQQGVHSKMSLRRYVLVTLT